jgi:glycosyltransferase involved in cell wall biosynthesis
MARLLGVEPGDSTVLYAGTVGQVHGVGVAVHAMKQLRETCPRAKLLIVGAGSDLETVRRLVESEELTNVTLVPPQPLEHMARTWTLVDIGLSTLRDLPIAEITRPAKILASMASGKPVVYSGAGEGARLVRDAEAGIVVSPEDPSALADAIALLVHDPLLATMLGTNGRTYVEQHLTWQAVVDTWLGDLPGTSPRIAKAYGT